MSVGASTSPIVIGGVAYVQDQSGTVYAIDVASGRVKWRTKAAGLQHRALRRVRRMGQAVRIHLDGRGGVPVVRR